MNEHTELTAERLSDVEVTKIAWDAEKCCSGHARCDDFERAINKALDMQAKLANVAKANVGAGGVVAYMHGDGTLYSKVRGESLLQSGAQNIEPLCRCKNPSTAQAALPELVAAAVKTDDGVIHFMPRPCRHHHTVHALFKMNGDASERGKQGFVLSDGTFSARPDALALARSNGQLLKPTDKPDLYSEDLW